MGALLLLAVLTEFFVTGGGRAAAAAVGLGGTAPVPSHLRVEGLLEPAAVISEPFPRFSFLHGDRADGGGFGITQASYRITVAAADRGEGQPLWDSGTVQSPNCSQIVYQGEAALTPFTRYVWSVQWTSSTGVESGRATARFETGPMAVSDWQGAGWLNGTDRWNEPPTVVRKSQLRNEFKITVDKAVTFARVYVAAAGCAHVELNGQVPLPNLRGICPWPVNSKGVRYMTHDITALVRPGQNALGMIAGHQPFASMRWHNPPQVLALVAVQFAGERTPTFPLTTSTTGWVGTEPYVTTSTPWAATIDCTRMLSARWPVPPPVWTTWCTFVNSHRYYDTIALQGPDRNERPAGARRDSIPALLGQRSQRSRPTPQAQKPQRALSRCHSPQS